MNTIDINDRNLVFLARVIARLSDSDKITFKQLPKTLMEELSSNISSPDAAVVMFDSCLDVITFTHSFISMLHPYFSDKKVVPQILALILAIRERGLEYVSIDERLGVYYTLDLFFLAKDALHCCSFNVAAMKSYFSSQLSGYYDIALQILVQRAEMRDATCVEDVYSVIMASGLAPITIAAANMVVTPDVSSVEYFDSYVRVCTSTKPYQKSFKTYDSLITGELLGNYDYLFDVVCENRGYDLGLMSSLLIVSKGAHDAVIKHIKRNEFIQEDVVCAFHQEKDCAMCYASLDYGHWNSALDIPGGCRIQNGFGFHKRWIDYDPIKYNACLQMVSRVQCDGWFLTLHCIEHIGMNAFPDSDGDKAILLERMMKKIISKLSYVSFTNTLNFLGNSLFLGNRNDPTDLKIKVNEPYKGNFKMYLEDIRKYSFLKVRFEPHFSVMSSVLQHSNYMAIERANSPLDSIYLIDSLPGYKCVTSNSGILICSPDLQKERMCIDELLSYRGSPYDGFLSVSDLHLTLPYERDVRELEHVDLIVRAEYRLMLGRKWYYK